MVNKKARRQVLRYRIRNKISGTPDRPRLAVYRSNKSIYCQLIDDLNGVTLASSSSVHIGAKGTKIDQAKEVGKAIAEKAKAAKIENVVLDRGGYLYHGRVKSLADGAREGGLQF